MLNQQTHTNNRLKHCRTGATWLMASWLLVTTGCRSFETSPSNQESTNEAAQVNNIAEESPTANRESDAPRSATAPTSETVKETLADSTAQMTERKFREITIADNQARIGWLLERGKPKAPSQLTATEDFTQIRHVVLRFVNNEPEATEFRVEMSKDGEDFHEVLTSSEDAVPHDNNFDFNTDIISTIGSNPVPLDRNSVRLDRRRISVGLGLFHPGVEYCFRVRALKDNRESNPSSVACFTIPRSAETCRDDADCAAGDMCFVECGETTGTCEPNSDTYCIFVYAPVCGCDGKTYSNSCVAASALVDVLHDGECESTCTKNSDCGDGEFCHFDFATCGGEGTCESINETCDPLYSPVCGCNGQTFANACFANAFGMSIAYNGICEAICINDSDCADGEFCSATGECLSADCTNDADCGFGRACVSAPGECGNEGTCTRTPELCPAVYDPVCGCDGNTYSNTCFALAEGVSWSHAGECQSGCTSDSQCGANEACVFPAGTCGGVGTCEATGNACAQFYDPVCGCDGNTYGNACGAQSVGVSVDHAGPCEDLCTSDQDCDDGNPCTEDTCQANGECVSSPITCDDGDECTIDYCDPSFGCRSAPGECDTETFTTSNSGRVTVGASLNGILSPGTHELFGDFGQIGSVFDDEGDHVINSVDGQNNLPYPLAPVTDFFGDWTLATGRGYAGNSQFVVWSVLDEGTRFVAVHFSMNSNYELTPVLLLAGNFTQPYGVVMQTTQFNGWAIEDGFTPEGDSPGFLRGWVSGTPFFQAPYDWNTVWSNPLTIEFDVLLYND